MLQINKYRQQVWAYSKCVTQLSIIMALQYRHQKSIQSLIKEVINIIFSYSACVHIQDCNSCFTCIPIHNHILLVLRNLTNERRRRNISSKYDYGTYGQTPNSNSENVDCHQNGQGMVLEEDRPTPIDVAIAATRDLHMQQAKGYGAFALRSVMLIRYSQKVSYPYYIYKIYCSVEILNPCQ